MFDAHCKFRRSLPYVKLLSIHHYLKRMLCKTFHKIYHYIFFKFPDHNIARLSFLFLFLTVFPGKKFLFASGVFAVFLPFLCIICYGLAEG